MYRFFCDSVYFVDFVQHQTSVPFIILSSHEYIYILYDKIFWTLKLVRTPFAAFKIIFLSMHLLPRMNVMLDFIWTPPVQLRGARNKWTLQKNLVHGTILSTNTTRPPDYKSTVITTRPQLAWYEMELKVHEI